MSIYLALGDLPLKELPYAPSNFNELHQLATNSMPQLQTLEFSTFSYTNQNGLDIRIEENMDLERAYEFARNHNHYNLVLKVHLDIHNELVCILSKYVYGKLMSDRKNFKEDLNVSEDQVSNLLMSFTVPNNLSQS